MLCSGGKMNKTGFYISVKVSKEVRRFPSRMLKVTTVFCFFFNGIWIRFYRLKKKLFSFEAAFREI